jgi:hypothetical protein
LGNSRHLQGPPVQGALIHDLAHDEESKRYGADE